MPQDGIIRFNVCLPKDDTTTLSIIDGVRGELSLSRSETVQRMLEYLCSCDRATLLEIIRTRHKIQNAC